MQRVGTPVVNGGAGTTRSAFLGGGRGSDAKQTFKAVGGSVLLYGAMGLAAGAAIGALFGYQKVRKRNQFREELTNNPCLDLSELYADDAAVDAFSEMMAFRTHDVEAWDTTLFCGNRILQLYHQLHRGIHDPNAVVEQIPHEIGDQLVQLHRALLAIRKKVTEKHSYMTTQFDDAAVRVQKRFSDVSYNAAADARDRKVRPVSTPVANTPPPPSSPFGKK